jgi:HEPN domain-containing protein
MKEKRDLIRAWIRRAESDLAIVEMCLANEKSLDAACFHSQQAAEKYLKAYLTAAEVEFPFVHNLEKLIEICSEKDPRFLTIKPAGEELTPYAVQARYDTDFWPPLDVVRGAREAATTIRDFVLGRLPPDVLKEA